jgi:hypothetical protein
MLLSLFDRLWTPTAIYLLLTLPIYLLRHVTNNTLAYGILLAWTAYYAQVVITSINFERAIDALGKRAPTKRTWSPYNLGTLLGAVWYFQRHRMHEWWWTLFGQHGNKSLPYTIESIIMGGRMIFTADEEVCLRPTCVWMLLILGLFVEH